MTTEKIELGTIQLNYANYQDRLASYKSNLKQWNNDIGPTVERYLLRFINKSGIKAHVAVSNFDGEYIIDFQFHDRLLAFVPAKNGTISVCITEGASDEGTPVRSTPLQYHSPEEFLNQYLVLNYVNFMIETLDEWDSQPN